MTRTVDTFYAVDFDRCLGSVDACFGLLQEIISERKLIALDDLQKAREYVESTGETFLVFDYLKTIAPLEQVEDIKSEFIRRGQERPGSLLEPGAADLLTWLQSTDRPFGILTHGESEWQISKIRATGLGEVPYLITEHKNKAQYVASWVVSADDRFVIDDRLTRGEPISAERVVLIDDRAVAFEGLPERAQGYWVVINGLVKTFQQGSVPENVVQISRISDVIMREQ